MCGGAIIDDIDYYNRVHEMMHILTSTQNRDNDDVEGFGERWGDKSGDRWDVGVLLLEAMEVLFIEARGCDLDLPEFEWLILLAEVFWVEKFWGIESDTFAFEENVDLA